MSVQYSKGAGIDHTLFPKRERYNIQIHYYKSSSTNVLPVFQANLDSLKNDLFIHIYRFTLTITLSLTNGWIFRRKNICIGRMQPMNRIM